MTRCLSHPRAVILSFFPHIALGCHRFISSPHRSQSLAQSCRSTLLPRPYRGLNATVSQCFEATATGSCNQSIRSSLVLSWAATNTLSVGSCQPWSLLAWQLCGPPPPADLPPTPDPENKRPPCSPEREVPGPVGEIQNETHGWFGTKKAGASCPCPRWPVLREEFGANRD